MTPIFPSLPRHIAGLALPALLLGCATSSEVTPYVPPVPQASAPVALAADASAASIAAQLRGAGYTVTRVSGAEVAATSRSNDNIDCGTITQVTFGNVGAFPGNAPSAVMYVSTDPIVITQRRVAVETDTLVTLADGQAQISETARVTISWTRADDSRSGSVTETVRAGALTPFTDGTSCTLTDRTAAQLR